MSNGDHGQEENSLKLPEQGSPAVSESVASGASGGAPATNLDLPTSVRIDAGSEGGVLGLIKDKGPMSPPSPN